MFGIKFLVSGWHVNSDGMWIPFKKITDYKEAKTYLTLANGRNLDNIHVKVDNIEVLYGAE